MAEITTQIVAPIWPQTADGKTVFNQKSDALAPQLITIQDDMNAYATEANALRDEVNGFQQTASAAAVAAANSASSASSDATLAEGYKNDAESAATNAANDVVDIINQTATSTANFVGIWSEQTGALNVPASVSEGNDVYLLLENLADVTLWQPSLNPDKWLPLSGGTGERLTFTKSFNANEERTYTLDGKASIPVVSVTKEVAQIGETNNQWDADVGGYEQEGGLLSIADTISLADLGGGVYTDNQHAPVITSTGGQINTTFWTDINSMVASETLNGQTINYALSNDDRTTWQIGLTGNSPRNIVRNNAGTWEYNSDATYGGETWTAATVNTEFDALSEAMEGASGTFGFALDNAIYDSVSFSVASQDGVPIGLAFSNDGTKMYILGTSDSVYQYTLSTAWNVGTASYDSVSFSVAGQSTDPYDLKLSDDGTKMFIIENSSDSVYQYTLSTAWNVGTASYESISFSVASQDIAPVGVAFNSDGTKMFVIGASNNIYQYTLSTAWNVGTASYDSVSFSVAGQETGSYGMAFSYEGEKMFIIGTVNDSVFQYSTETTLYSNQMPSSQLQALTDAEQIVLGNELDLAVVLFTNNSTVTPAFSGMTIDYDANIKNQVAIEGTDYEWWSYEDTDITIKALADNNLKGRVL